MDEQPIQEHIIELVSWLEKVGQEGDAHRNLADFLRGHRKTCRKTGYSFARIPTEGLLEVRFWLPMFEIEKVFDLVDRDQLSKWLHAINIDGIEASLIDDSSFGECVLVKRLHYIPTDQRDRWISPHVIPNPDSAVLAILLNRVIQDTPGKDDG